MSSFADLGVRPPLVAALHQAGIDQPFPIQSLTIPDALAGRDVCGKAQTGSGKTLAFALPMIERVSGDRDAGGRPGGLVLVHTPELAVQVRDVMKPLAGSAGLKVTAVYGGVSLERQRIAASKGTDIVVATPGRLIDLVERRLLRLDRVSIVVIDEADRMADFGFLPQVEHILRWTKPAEPQHLLFSATLDGQVKRLVDRYLADPVHHNVVAETATVQEMGHVFLAVHQMDRVKVAASISRAVDRTLVFVRTKRGADRLAAQLQREGVKVGAIHGDLRQGARERALKAFASDKLPVLVATDVAARGIHVDDIDVVIHFDPPEDHKSYLHRSGRTARAGQAGMVATFVLWNQVDEVGRLQKRLGLAEPIVEIFSNDARLADLATILSAASIAS